MIKRFKTISILILIFLSVSLLLYAFMLKKGNDQMLRENNKMANRLDSMRVQLDETRVQLKECKEVNRVH